MNELPSIACHLETLLAKNELSSQAAAEIMRQIVSGTLPPASIAAVAVALRAKGESSAEIAAFARVMRETALKVQAPEGILDTCGTGGDGSRTFNISTATAFVAAGMGIPVAKHGGRAASSKSGSAEVLRELGVNIDAKVSVVERCIREARIGFLFAPAHHPGMKHVSPVRKELGVRTIFNLLGPLSNPAGAKLQVLGVFEPSLCERFAPVLKLLGSQRAMVVCGTGPGGKGHLDELSTFGPTRIAQLKNGAIAVEEIDAANFGIPRPAENALHASDPAQSAQIIRAVLGGAKGPPRDIVVLNAAAAALVCAKTESWNDALKLAGNSIDGGKARAALEKLVQISNAAD